MNVLMFSWEYPPHSVGGLGKHVTELLPALAGLGVRVDLVTPRWSTGAEREVVAPVKGGGRERRQTVVHRVPPPAAAPDIFERARATGATIEAFGRELWESGGPYDLIHVHDWLVAFPGVALKHAFRAPLLTTIHATEYGRWRGWIGTDLSRAIHNTEWWLTYEAWRVICCSRFMAGEVELALRVPTDKVDVIPNGVDTRRFEVLAGVDLTEFRARFATPSQKIIFYVGRVTFEKGVHLLVDAMPPLLAAGEPVKLVVAGTGPNLAEVRQRAATRGVADHCYFTGFIPDEDRDRLFKVADVAAFPSLYEPFGIVALEAMAAGAPVVAAEVGGLTEVVQHGETAVTVFPNDVGSLVWGIRHVLDHPDRAQQRVRNAARMVVEQFNWPGIARQTRAVYERVVAERKQVTWV